MPAASAPRRTSQLTAAVVAGRALGAVSALVVVVLAAYILISLAFNSSKGTSLPIGQHQLPGDRLPNALRAAAGRRHVARRAQLSAVSASSWGKLPATAKDGVLASKAAASRSGAGRSLEQAAEQELRPRIYVYPLPAQLHNCTRESWTSEIYGAELRLPLALNASRYVTDDPNAADLYYVPALLYCNGYVAEVTGGVVHTYHDQVRAALAYIRTHWPYWDRHNGSDHIWTFTQDHGYCGFGPSEGTVEEIQNSHILSHWGLEDPEGTHQCSLQDRVLNYGKCPGRHEAAGTNLPCFVPGKDTVIPNTGFDHDAEPAQAVANKTLVFFMAGDIREDTIAYSHGVRQQVYVQFRDQPGFKIVKGAYEGYWADMASATFCLAATGSGWGVRLKLALQRRCIPVVIADRVQMEFEDVLPYEAFALRIPQHAIYQLPKLLAGVMAHHGRVEAMQKAIDCVWRYYVWQGTEGRALEALLCSLRMQTLGVTPRLDLATCQLHCGQ